VEGGEVRVLQRLRQPLRRKVLEVRAEQLHAVLAEAAAVAGGEDRQVGLVEMDARDTRVDLDPDDRLQVLAPDRVVPVHQVRVVLVAVDVPRRALLEDVGDLLPIAVHESVREVVLERLPDLGIGVLRELPQPEKPALADAAELVHRQDLGLVVVQLDRELPALDLEDAAEHLDAALLAALDELRVVHEPVEAEPGVDLAPGLLLEVRERDRSAAERRPHQRGRVVGLEVLDHLEPPRRQARVVAVLPGEPCVKVHAAFQGQPLPASVRGDTRSASRLRSN
jgi:hypothetical protein